MPTLKGENNLCDSSRLIKEIELKIAKNKSELSTLLTRKKQLLEKRQQDIFALYKEGKTMAEIARRCDVSRQYVGTLLKNK